MSAVRAGFGVTWGVILAVVSLAVVVTMGVAIVWALFFTAVSHGVVDHGPSVTPSAPSSASICSGPDTPGWCTENYSGQR